MTQIRRIPATSGRDTSTTATVASPHSNGHRAEDGYTAPTAEDRAVEAAIAVLRGYGYGIAMRCLDCRRPITSPSSLARMRGPRCAAKAVGR